MPTIIALIIFKLFYVKLKHVFVSSKLNQGHLDRRNYGEKLAAIPHDKYFMIIEQYGLLFS